MFRGLNRFSRRVINKIVGHFNVNLIITRESSRLIRGIPEMSASGLCNSKVELMTIALLRVFQKCGVQVKSKRKEFFFRDVNIVDIKDELRKTLFSWTAHERSAFECKMNIETDMDKHAPEQVKVITLRPHALQCNIRIIKMKRERR